MSKTCSCGYDGTHNATVEKFLPFLPKKEAEAAYAKLCKKKTRGFSNTKIFYQALNLTDEEIAKNISDVQTCRSKLSPSTQPGARGYSKRTIEYWIKQGFSEDEAHIQLKKFQTRNGLPWYISKYGEEEGERLFNLRIEKWLNHPNNKKMIKGRSKNSLKLFESLHCQNSFWGSTEKTVRGKSKVHRIDFIHDKNIIEFFGDYWHANPQKYKAEDKIKKKIASDIWLHDQNKIDDLCANGYNILIVWESEYSENPEK